MVSGGLDVVPVDLPAVVNAGKAVGTYINVERNVYFSTLYAMSARVMKS
jgi:hypothetical protein